jgi:Na+/H+-dicarboxylate symporter/ABC-type amino acid transport substrate-binding protein
MTPDPRANRDFARILIAIGAGILAGIFFGESIRPLDAVANGFIKLLQVNVLPYMLGSLIASLGSRGTAEMKVIARYGIVLVLLVWGLALLLVVLSPLAFPVFGGVPVFGIEEPSTSVDWLELYIPSNLFRALSNNLIPAVVIFGILAGVALGQTTNPGKEVLLQALSAFNAAMARVSRMILSLTPYGLFAIAAVTAGEIRIEDVLRLQVWFYLYAGGTLLFTLWVLPKLAERFTGVPAARFLAAMRGPIVTAAAAGDALVVLPLIAESAKTLLVEQGVPADGADQTVGVAVPLIYNFPHAGKILSLAFLPFAAWFSGSALGVRQFLLLVSAGPLSLFGNINAAMPFLLDLLHQPDDLFQLFSISSVINSRFGSMASAANNAALGLILAAAMLGSIQWSIRRLAEFVAVTAVLMLVFVASTRALFTWVLPPAPSGMETLAPLVLRPPLAPVVSGTAGEVRPEPGKRFQEIKARGVIRVGYFGDAIPWAFINADGTLVGYDIEAAHRLATQLGVALDFIQIDRASPQPSLALTEGRVDILMTGFTATLRRAEQMELSRSYASEHIGFLVHDFDRGKFATMASLNEGEGLVVVVPHVEEAEASLQALLPKAKARDDVSIDQFAKDPDIAAVLTTLERAYYWSHVYPEFTAVRPVELTTATALVYAMPRGEVDLKNVVDLWVETRRASGDADEAYDYWIRGKALTPRSSKWSVIHNVLGWR